MSNKLSPIIVAIIAAISGIIGTIGGAYIQGSSAGLPEIEKRKTSLIEKATQAPSNIETINQLWFYVKAGLIDDPEGKIELLAKTKSVNIARIDNPSALTDKISTNGVCGLDIDGIKTLYRYGDILSPAISTKKECYIVVLVIDSTGATSTLYPNKFDRAKTKQTQLDFATLHFSLVAREPPGANLLIIIASDEPIIRSDESHIAIRGGAYSSSDIAALLSSFSGNTNLEIEVRLINTVDDIH